MKAKTYKIESEKEKEYCLLFVSELPTDGSTQVTIQNVDKSATAAQRRLAWMWAGEVAKSGIGQEDTKDMVHIRAKYKFAIPILLRDSVTFGAIYAGFSEMIEQIDRPRNELWLEFTRDYVSTEKMTRAQRAEYLREFQLFWTGQGVFLSDPDNYGKDLLKYA